MKVPKLILGGILFLSAQAFSQTDSTKKEPKDTTKTYALMSTAYTVLDTVPQKDTTGKDTTTKKDLALINTRVFALDTVPEKEKDTTKKDTTYINFNDVAKGPFIAENDFLVLDTVPEKEKDTTRKDTLYTNFNSVAKGPFIAEDNFLVLDTVPKKDKDTTTKKDSTDNSFNVAGGPFLMETDVLILDTVPTDTSKKTRVYGSLAPIPQTEPLTEFKSSAPAPNAGKYYVAVLGTYQSVPNTTTNSATESAPSAVVENVSITLDEQNPGKIWIEGIGEGRFYAYLKTQENTYKIPTQKAGDKTINEGIVMYDESAKQVHIRVGSGYNDADPGASLNATVENATVTDTEQAPAKKGKTVAKNVNKETKKLIVFDGNKTNVETAASSSEM